LTPTEYYALCNVLEFCWELLRNEPELCEQKINYMNNYDDDGNQIDVIKTGECGLGFSEAFEYTLDEPNARNMMTMVTNLMYKLNCNPILAHGLGNSWETLSSLVDKEELDRIIDGDDDSDATMQTIEKYKLENIGLENKISKVQEYHDNVNEIGMVQVSENLWMDLSNSDTW
jgi:hypothetical protein